jgi:hypothetical protein
MAPSVRRAAVTWLQSRPMLNTITRKAQFWVWKTRVKLTAGVALGGIDPHRTLWVEPDAIRDAIRWGPELYSKFGDRGKVLGGDWDLNTTPFAELDVYRGFADHFQNGIPWETTEFHARVMSEIAAGKTKWNAKTPEEFKARLKYLDELFQTIKNEGFKTAREAGGYQSAWAGAEDDISVRIGRDGDLLFEDGRHRLSIAKILGVTKVPVKVTVRHRAWFDFIKQVERYAREHDGKVYNVVAHPDLDHLPALHGWDRLKMIVDHLPMDHGSVLDIGAHWGFFCHELEKRGFDCVAVEAMPQHVYFMERLKRAGRRRFDIVESSIFDYRDRSEFDLVLALYVFHHFLKTKELHERLIELLGRLQMRAMVFGCHNHDQDGMQTAYRNYPPEEFVNFILEHSNLRTARLIGHEEGRRAIYLLEA